MGIVRTVEWRIVAPPDAAQARLLSALKALGADATSRPGHITASMTRALSKNHWAATINMVLRPTDTGATAAVCKIDMAGNKHYAILDEIVTAAGEEAFDDRGLSAAVNELGRPMDKFVARREVRHLPGSCSSCLSYWLLEDRGTSA